ncbi:uncharacterized protein SPPG_08295 [Spizellomyces punctatus DAOM BR117]|uniref:Helicase ATP-binding domain-containing protein n=1 Tax=Spizellomyces punctatus (strain DAOM BR117) TaxID=645134 RepID=A0A0L0H659_SPIPD|nr:uncharacterized protein SPPG_08295 [Spizellomyces punctatus DAOM BR117]KNC96396.1 hypothetical protein SPPG_08295 [Spizellomyces punctatus DAOM BR117]|eukprot:XP_016604436.1 hypothetical protein SPPG_08295 [Spizellomyces punctatus DAOM BR117]
MESQPLRELLVQSHAVHVQNPDVEELRTDFFHKACGFFLSCSSPGDHILCSNPDIAVEVLGLFSLQDISGTPVETVVTRLAAELNCCRSCVDTYQSAKDAFYCRYISLYGEALIDAFMKRLHEWDLMRQYERLGHYVTELRSFRNSPGREWKKARRAATILMYEILSYPETLRNSEVDALWVALFHEISAIPDSSPLELRGKYLMPGSIMLASHADTDMRMWAQSAIRKSSARITLECLEKNEMVRSLILDLLLLLGDPDLLRARVTAYRYTDQIPELWKALAVVLWSMEGPAYSVLENLEKNARVDLNELIISHLSTAVEEFWETLECFVLLATRRPSLWSSLNADRALTLCKSILLNAKFQACVRSDSCVERLSICVSWVGTLIRSSFGEDILPEILNNSTEWCSAAQQRLDSLLLSILQSFNEHSTMKASLACRIGTSALTRFSTASSSSAQIIGSMVHLLRNGGNDAEMIVLGVQALEFFSAYLVEQMTAGTLHATAWMDSFMLPACLLSAGIRWAKAGVGPTSKISDLILKTLSATELSIELFSSKLHAKEMETYPFQETFSGVVKWMISLDPQIPKKAFRLVYELFRVSWRANFAIEPSILARLEKISNGTLKSLLTTGERVLLETWLSQNRQVLAGADIPGRPPDMVLEDTSVPVIDLVGSDDTSPEDKATSSALGPMHGVHKPLKESSKNALGVGKATHTSAEDLALQKTITSHSQPTTDRKAASQMNSAHQSSIDKFVLKSNVQSVWEQLAADALRNPISRAGTGFSLGKPSTANKAAKTKGPTTLSKLQKLRQETAEKTKRATPLVANGLSTGKPLVLAPQLPTLKPSLPEVTILPYEPEASSFSAFDKPTRTQMLEDKGSRSTDVVKRVGTLIRTPGIQHRPKALRDVKQLYKCMLSWNLDMSGDRPPNFQLKCRKIPDSFRNDEEYAKVFEPLVTLECWEQLMQSKDNVSNEDAITATLENVQMVDEFHDLTITVSSRDIRLRGIAELDVLQLKEMISPKLATRTINRSFLCIIQNVTIKGDGGTIIARACIGSRADLVPSIRLASKWQLTRTFSLTTTYREYMSIVNLPMLHLRSEILQLSTSEKIPARATEVDDMMNRFGLNEPQAAAISGALHQQSGFTLIQGPPGTGKTKTILGLISAFLTVKQGQIIPVPGQNPGRKQPIPNSKKNRLLCCAPSNAAIDEIVRRLKQGISNGKGGTFVPRIVRLGNSDSIHSSVRDVTLDAIVDRMLQESDEYQKYLTKAQEVDVRDEDIRAEMAVLRDERESLRAQEADDNVDGPQAQDIHEKIAAVTKKLGALHEKLTDGKQARSTTALARDKFRRRIRLNLLTDADVILSTLSGAGHDVLGDINNLEFPTVIVDEACQSVELSTLIPLRYGAKKCILVGDPNQLPPTVISQVAQEYSYEQSLFQRIMKNNPECVHLLSIQYRMHPAISQFPSICFYGAKVQDAPGMEESCTAPWHRDELFPPYRLYDIHNGREVGGKGHSYYNPREVKLCVDLVESLCAGYPTYNFAGKIGVITFYKLQVRKIKDELIRRWSRDVLRYIDVNTVDGFQGQEKEVIILSCVRANDAQGVGFISDARRMNVALTRSKYSLVILGNVKTLRTNKAWRSLVSNADERRLISRSLPSLPGKGYGPPPQNILKNPSNASGPDMSARPDSRTGASKRRWDSDGDGRDDIKRSRQSR